MMGLSRMMSTTRRLQQALSTAVAKIQVELVSPDWPVDPTAIVTFGLERSFDNGQTWQVWKSATTISGHRGKNNALPSLRAPRKTGAFLVRPFQTVSGATVVTPIVTVE